MYKDIECKIQWKDDGVSCDVVIRISLNDDIPSCDNIPSDDENIFFYCTEKEFKNLSKKDNNEDFFIIE